MQKITPHLWFDTQAKEAAAFYSEVFPMSSVESSITLNNPDRGDFDLVMFTLWGYKFMAINAGPLFKINPSISFFVNYDPLLFKGASSPEAEARKQLDKAWEKLAEGGNVLMPIDKYPFSERYGWIQDKYGVTWQLMLTNPQGEPAPPIIPSFMFIGENAGRAEEAMTFYTGVFRDSKVKAIFRYGTDQTHDKPENIMFADFNLGKQVFAAMDSSGPHKFQFNEAVSLLINCETQKEIDYYTNKLSADPKSEQCGWVKDKYGVSWQIHPSRLDSMFTDPDRKRVERVVNVFLKMKRIDLAALEKAYAGS